MSLKTTYDADGITVLSNTTSINDLAARNRRFAFALADVRRIGDSHAEGARIEDERVWMRHRVAASLEKNAADALGLPPLVDLTFQTDVQGALGTESFRLRHEWSMFGCKQNPQRVGAILRTEDGDRRLPLWLLDAVEVAEGFEPGTDLAAHWEALARFRRALDPGVEMAADPVAARVSMTDFLQGLEVRLADSFGVAPRQGVDGDALLDFDPVPYCRPNLEGIGEDEVTEGHSELSDESLLRFQEKVRSRGSLPAYLVGDGSYLVIDRGAHAVLDVMAKKQRATPTERDAFVRNPRAAISEAVEIRLRKKGELQGLSPEGEQEAIERAAGPAFVETVEYSARVIGTIVYRDPQLELPSTDSTAWLPETFDAETADTIQNMADAGQAGQEEPAAGPLILDTEQNVAELRWNPQLKPQTGTVAKGMPEGIVTALKDYQVDGLEWQKECWSSGLSGVLNADEQGLGKTLQTIAFLRWRQDLAQSETTRGKPVLVVAPTSLLLTWEAEVKRHTDLRGLGYPIRLYGSGLGGHKTAGTKGIDTESGEAKLDFSMLTQAIEEGRGHRFWMLTTYATLTNYQHSLARVPFAVTVFDEIQALKNPASLRSFAARAIQSDFRIGLTGTPIENRTSDLWAILDQLAPGALGTLREFNDRYAAPDESNMRELHGRVFAPCDRVPKLAMRRTKGEVARQLPKKERRLHPRVMPSRQAAVYNAARLKVGRGQGVLKALHHIRSVSVHPDLALGQTSEDFIDESARLDAAFEVIQQVREKRERALVFIEYRRVQYRFAEWARSTFDLPHIDIINADTPIRQRQSIVERFQRHVTKDGGFDLLVLGTRAAGTGLTLTAATHVIHISRWWNPAVEEQCNDRVHRIGQERPVTVHMPMAIHPSYREHSFDCLLHSLMNRKRRLASSALWPMGDTATDVANLQRDMAMEASDDSGDPVDSVRVAMTAMFARDGKRAPQFAPDGSLECD